MQLLKDWEGIKNQIAKIQDDTEELNISPVLVIMIISAEDHRFCSHSGVDLISILRAIWRSIFCGKKEGGSTIAMQLVRVITGRYERTLIRKITEIYLAIRLTRYVRKIDLPKLYLFVAYFGWEMNGLAQAAARLRIDPSNLSKAEAANLVARLKYPEPRRHNIKILIKIRDRTKYILLRSDTIFGSGKALQLNPRKSNGSF